MKPVSAPMDWRQIAVIVIVILSVEIAFLNTPGVGDRNRWLLYMDLARTHGIRSLYSTVVNLGVGNGSPALNLFKGDHFRSLHAVMGGVQTDYPPLGIMILGAASKIADRLSLTDFITVKLLISAFMLACAGIAAVWRGRWHPVFGLAVFMALVPNGLMLSYIDPFFLFFFLLALFLFDRGSRAWGVAAYAVACLVKWQPIILGPFVVLFVLPRKFKVLDCLPLLSGIAVVLIAYAIFGNDMIRAFLRGTGEDHLSSLGLNLNWLYTAYVEFKTHTLRDGALVDSLLGISHHPLVKYGSRSLAYLVYAAALFKFYRSNRTTLAFVEASIIAFLGYGMFYTNVHENHLLLVAIMALFWAFLDRARLLDAVMLTLMLNLNMYIFFGADGNGFDFSRTLGVDVTIYMALLNVVYSIWLMLQYFVFGFGSRSLANPADGDKLNERSTEPIAPGSIGIDRESQSACNPHTPFL